MNWDNSPWILPFKKQMINCRHFSFGEPCEFRLSKSDPLPWRLLGKVDFSSLFLDLSGTPQPRRRRRRLSTTDLPSSHFIIITFVILVFDI